MALEDLKQLKTVNCQPQAQELLDAGWILLAVCVIQGDFNQYAEYHLGHPDKPAAEVDLAKKDLLEGLNKLITGTEQPR